MQPKNEWGRHRVLMAAIEAEQLPSGNIVLVVRSAFGLTHNQQSARVTSLQRCALVRKTK